MKLSDISAIIKTQIQNFEAKITASEEGKIISMGDGIALIDGLDKAMLGELLLFPDNTFGMVLNLEEDVVGAVLMGSDAKIREGDTVRRTGKIIEVPVGDQLLGRVVNALGQQIDGGKEIKTTKNRPIERIAPGVMTRKSVDEPLETGIISIDSMIPIGKGQRELIIGDRQIGKTAVAIDVIINQKGKDVKCVYVAIGQKNSTVVQVVEKLKEHDAMDYVVIVSATASQQASLQYLAPYAGVTMAEEWMEKGEDVLIVYDDLTKHAIAYRTLSLLLRRPPGREAFPGDVFYLHSRLLERAAKLNDKHGGGSITALPIIETQAGDISAYIPTNVISITDGQLFMMSDLFNSGQRPAVDSAYSVSRVGSSAQIKAMKKVSGSLRLELAQYKELKSFSQFGSDIDSETKAVLDHGERAMSFLKQAQYSPLSQSLQVIMLLAVKERLTGYIPIEYIEEFKKAIIQKFSKREGIGVLKKLDQVKDLDEKMIEEIIFQLKMCVIKVCRKHPNYDYHKHPDHPAHELNKEYDEQKSIRDEKRAEDANKQNSDETNQPTGSEKEVDQKPTTSPATTSKPKLAKLEEVKEDDQKTAEQSPTSSVDSNEKPPKEKETKKMQKEVEKQPISPVDSTEKSTNEKEVKGSDQKPAEKSPPAPQGIEKIISEVDKEVIEDMQLPDNQENLDVKQIKTLNEKKKEANLPFEDIAHSLDPLPKKDKDPKNKEKNNQNAKYSSNKTKN